MYQTTCSRKVLSLAQTLMKSRKIGARDAMRAARRYSLIKLLSKELKDRNDVIKAAEGHINSQFLDLHV
jgi:hypothetical protein